MSVTHDTQSVLSSLGIDQLSIAWPIARLAAGHAQHGLVSSGRGGRILLEMTILPTGSCRAELRDEAASHGQPIELTSPDIQMLGTDEFVHMDVTECGVPVFAATVRCNESGVRLLYAKTTLLDRLGIRGGRYSRPVLTSPDF